MIDNSYVNEAAKNKNSDGGTTTIPLSALTVIAFLWIRLRCDDIVVIVVVGIVVVGGGGGWWWWW